MDGDGDVSGEYTQIESQRQKIGGRENYTQSRKMSRVTSQMMCHGLDGSRGLLVG
jgi:hypothetical protein